MCFMLPAHLHGESKGLALSSSSDKHILQIAVSDSAPFSSSFYSTAAYKIAFFDFLLAADKFAASGISVWRLVNYKKEISGRT